MDKKFNYKKVNVGDDEFVVVNVTSDDLKNHSLEEIAAEVKKKMKADKKEKEIDDKYFLKFNDLGKIMDDFSITAAHYVYKVLDFDGRCEIECNTENDKKTGKAKIEIKIFTDSTKTKLIGSYHISNY